MKKFLLLLFVFLCILVSSSSNLVPVFADEISDLQKQIDELTKVRQQSEAATKPLEGQFDSLRRQLAQIQAKLENLSNNIAKKQRELDSREDQLAEKNAMLETRVRLYYIRSYLTSPLLVILSSQNPSELFRELALRLNAAKEDRELISSITAEAIDLLNQKEKLEKDKDTLAVLQAEVDKNAKFLGGEVSKAKAYQADLTSKIVSLTAKQQQILSQRLASLNISRSAASIGVCADDRHIDPGFSNAFAFFTYGAPHRVGMNQFGAKGRAEAGQGREDILKAYYTNFETVKWDTNTKIKVQGYGEFSLEEYVQRIYEVPESWPMAALEAQVIAARSFALAYTNNGSGEICTSEQCQVFKPDPKTGQWVQAVKATEGLVMTSGGNPIKAWYASTHGGYVFSSAEVWG